MSCTSNTLEALQKFLQLEHLYLKLLCHTNAQYLIACSNCPHSLLVAMEDNYSVFHHLNTKYSCIVCVVTICNACSRLIAKKIIGLESARRVLMIREVWVSFCWQKVGHEQKKSTSEFFFHDTTKKQWKCWKCWLWLLHQGK